VGTAGDHAANLVERVVKKLLVRPFYTDSEGAALVDAIVDSTLQYTLPTLGSCCEYNPFCGTLDDGCQSESMEGAGEGVKRFSRASERGEFRAARQGFFYPGSVFGYQVLEDPGRGSLKAGGSVGVRRAAWEILDEVIGLRFVNPECEEEATTSEADMGGNTQSVSVESDTVDGHDDINLDLNNESEMKGDMVVEPASQTTSVEGVKNETSTEIDIDLQSSKHRTVTEYIRSSNRITPHTISLDPPSSTNSQPRALQSLQDRLRTYLIPFQANTPSINRLPTRFQPIVAILRFCILDSTNWPGHEQSWRLSEIEAVLKACLGTYGQWEREGKGDVPSKKELEMPYPLLNSRNAQLAAHLQATMTDSLTLAESLLLSNTDRADRVGEREKDVVLTHLQVYKFYSGQTLHTFLNRQVPEGWKWRECEQATYDQCWTALIDGIKDQIVGYTDSSTLIIGDDESREREEVEGEVDIKEIEVVEKEVGKKRKKSKGKGGGGKNSKSSGGGGGGRFDLLNGLDD